jgi:hypothetical protein
MSTADAIVLASEELVIAARDAEWQRVPALLLARRVLLQDLERRASREVDLCRLEAVRGAVLESDRVFATLRSR